MIDFTLFVLSVSFGVIYVDNLTAPNGLFEFFDGAKIRIKILSKLLTCPVCLTGQCALWSYLIQYWGNYNAVDHLALVFGAMLTTHVINRLLP